MVTIFDARNGTIHEFYCSLVCIPKVYRSYVAARNDRTKAGAEAGGSGRLPPDLVSLTVTVLLIVGAFLFCYILLWVLMTCQFLVQIKLIPSTLFVSAT